MILSLPWCHSIGDRSPRVSLNKTRHVGADVAGVSFKCIVLERAFELDCRGDFVCAFQKNSCNFGINIIGSSYKCYN